MLPWLLESGEGSAELLSRAQPFGCLLKNGKRLEWKGGARCYTHLPELSLCLGPAQPHSYSSSLRPSDAVFKIFQAAFVMLMLLGGCIRNSCSTIVRGNTHLRSLSAPVTAATPLLTIAPPLPHATNISWLEFLYHFIIKSVKCYFSANP